MELLQPELVDVVEGVDRGGHGAHLAAAGGAQLGLAGRGLLGAGRGRGGRGGGGAGDQLPVVAGVGGAGGGVEDDEAAAALQLGQGQHEAGAVVAAGVGGAGAGARGGGHLGISGTLGAVSILGPKPLCREKLWGQKQELYQWMWVRWVWPLVGVATWLVSPGRPCRWCIMLPRPPPPPRPPRLDTVVDGASVLTA